MGTAGDEEVDEMRSTKHRVCKTVKGIGCDYPGFSNYQDSMQTVMVALKASIYVACLGYPTRSDVKL